MKEKNPEFEANIVQNYDLLNEIGILDNINTLKDEIKNLEDLLEEAIELFNKHTVMDLVQHITTKMLEKFIPSYLAFVLQEELNPDIANIICFKNMKLIKNMIEIDSIKPFRKFFLLSPTSITFEAFKHMIDDSALTDIFLPLSPELLVPLMGLDGVYGFIVFGRKILDNEYTNHEIEYINRIMKFASASLQNNVNYKRAIVDAKTKLYTHAFFIKKLEEELSRIKRYNSQLSILMLDLDNFKNLNDTYGHLVGDRVLSFVSRIIVESIRKEDIAARFGGEEFVVMLVETGQDGAIVVAERIRRLVEELKILNMDINITITISIGISCASKEKMLESKELLKQADDALYFSKENGKNQYRTYSEIK